MFDQTGRLRPAAVLNLQPGIFKPRTSNDQFGKKYFFVVIVQPSAERALSCCPNDRDHPQLFFIWRTK